MMRKLAGLVVIVVAVLLANVALAGNYIGGDPVVIEDGNLELGLSAQAGTLLIQDGSGNTLTIDLSTVTTWTLTLPTNAGTVNYLVYDDGNGNWGYVDPDTVGTNYWQLDGDDLEPNVANRKVNIETTDAGTIGSYKRALRIHTAGNYHRGITINTAGTGSDGLYSYTTGNSSTPVEAWSFGTGSNAIYGYAEGTDSHAIVGELGGASAAQNTTYAGRFTRLDFGDWADGDEQSGDPATGPAGFSRLFSRDNSVTSWKSHGLFHIDSSGNIHDTVVQHKQIWDCALLAFLGIDEAGRGGEDTKWSAAAHALATGNVAITSTAASSFDFTNYELDDRYGRWTWPAEYVDPPGILIQNQLAVGVPFRKFGDGADRDGNCRVIVKARIRVNNTTYFDSIKIFLNDVNTTDVPQNSALSADYLGSMSNNTWYEATFALNGSANLQPGVDIGTWEKQLRCGVVAIGKNWASAGTYTTTIDLETISVEQHVD